MEHVIHTSLAQGYLSWPACRTHLDRVARVPAKAKQPVCTVGGLLAGSSYMRFAWNYRRQHLYMCVPLEPIRNGLPCVHKANLYSMEQVRDQTRAYSIFAFCSLCSNQPARRCTAIISIKNTWHRVLYHPADSTLNYAVSLPLHKLHTPLKQQWHKKKTCAARRLSVQSQGSRINQGGEEWEQFWGQTFNGHMWPADQTVVLLGSFQVWMCEWNRGWMEGVSANENWTDSGSAPPLNLPQQRKLHWQIE